MSIIATVIGWAAIAIAGYFIVKFTIQFVWDKIDKYFTQKEVEVDETIAAEIPSMMKKCENTKSYEVLKKAREKGYTHIMAKTSGGKIIDGVEIFKDTSATPDQEVKDLLGDEGMVIIKR